MLIVFEIVSALRLHLWGWGGRREWDERWRQVEGRLNSHSVSSSGKARLFNKILVCVQSFCIVNQIRYNGELPI